MLHYIASKGAIIAMTRSLANEFGCDNVLVNAAGSPNLLNGFSAAAIAGRFLKRDATAMDVARVIGFLASDNSDFVTGQIIAADGGSVMH